ncbi:type I glyceraldehyde-3-phosphate dehydrogenase [Planctomyces sp. SH-PL62]|uniref:type I glyceraldehyde-3-phosphate dehydrogenase n=1 Tax=Planctomyces sp. SH-PL62 TaxID=1636152 RepID=UPI00078E1DA9|nr:type I glyceraldehyde-3-phosphate dehydrogenase [Planctomyces sp. SH-PL62]AMV39688.1 Glyceraldehyde-3-phosphate dehydrogenase [Planctomyces sp. SH-PL62]
MSVRVGINGFGRIGRLVFRVLAQKPEQFDVVAINDLADPKHLAYLLKYDSVHGRFNGTVEAAEKALVVNGKKIAITSEKDPVNLPWKSLGCQVALESTGFFTSKEQLQKHIDAGADRVILSAPAKDKLDATIVLGVNDSVINKDLRIVSNASCTTNCLAPLAKVINDTFGIEKGLMTTIHAYTNDQRVADQIHSDLYRSRAAAINMIPTKTGAAKAVGEVIPELNGKLTGFAMRVPVPDGSVVDLTAILKKSVTRDELNAAVKAAADGPLKGILEYNADPIVSTDIIGNPHSSIFVPDQTIVLDGNFVKVLSWYDNEWGYSNRTVELIAKLGAL